MGTEQKRGIRKSQVGIVTSTAMKKTVTVAVDRFVEHPLYKKILRRTSKFLAHDESEMCRVGDRVRIAETRPLSARKRWRIVENMTIQKDETRMTSGELEQAQE
jgi:small subunit ribosomal protein S17